MDSRHEDNDGSDIFWPGYVDATTNLILNLLFLLTILMVAVFMFALELGRSSPIKPENPSVVSHSEDTEAVPAGTRSAVAAVRSSTRRRPGSIHATERTSFIQFTRSKTPSDRLKRT